MDTEKVQKRFGLGTVVVTALSSFFVATGGAAAWATQFQTKAKAAEQAVAHESRMKATEDRLAKTETSIGEVGQKVSDVKDTVDRMEGKVDQLLLRGRR